jgi:hypothetical protein
MTPETIPDAFTLIPFDIFTFLNQTKSGSGEKFLKVAEHLAGFFPRSSVPINVILPEQVIHYRYNPN